MENNYDISKIIYVDDKLNLEQCNSVRLVSASKINSQIYKKKISFKTKQMLYFSQFT